MLQNGYIKFLNAASLAETLSSEMYSLIAKEQHIRSREKISLR